MKKHGVFFLPPQQAQFCAFVRDRSHRHGRRSGHLRQQERQSMATGLLFWMLLMQGKATV